MKRYNESSAPPHLIQPHRKSPQIVSGESSVSGGSGKGPDSHVRLSAFSNGSIQQNPLLCLHQIFEAQVVKTPEAVAVTFEEKSLSYRELNERSNRLAHHLQSMGVGPETLVAICTERSLELIIGLLGILKAGGAYLPIDLAYPRERLAFMLEDAGVEFILTQETLLGQLPSPQPRESSNGVQSARQVFCLDRDWKLLEGQPASNPRSSVKPENLAYVIYTSGSTGKPKGVLVTHFNVVRLFTATAQWFHFNENDAWTLFHSYAFDFSVWEIWGALLYGGRLVVVPYLVSRSPQTFYELLSKEKITVLNQTPSAFRQLIWAEGSLPQPLALSLRYVIFGGEALELQSLKPWYDRHGDQQPLLINMYGITETTVHVTYRPLSLSDLSSGKGSVIGGPIPDLELYVLDDQLRPCPPGTEGEMFVGGAGVARGYLHRPELTAQRFIPHPFKAEGGTLYRSGDLARVLENGDLEYLGRMDYQVKIRGFRIELGEIETLLHQHPAIREGIVIAHGKNQEEKSLVAYLASNQKTPPSISELRDFLKTKLPEYMVPSVFMFLESLPLTPNGKVDRRALPRPNKVRPELRECYEPATTPDEMALAEIWSEVLNLQPVGIKDNFFELGGDSIRTIQIIARAREKGLHFTLPELVQHQTIAELLAGTLPKKEKTAFTSLAPFSLVRAEDRQNLPAGLEDAYPVIELQAGMFYHSELHPGSAVYHDIFSYRIQAPFDEAKLRRAARRLTERHTILRTSFDLSTYSEPLQLVHREAEIPFAIADLRHLTSEDQKKEIDQWMEMEKARPFDWSRAPLLRFQFHRRDDASFQFTYGSHHAILDGWSLAAMLTELLQLYAHELNPEENRLRPPAAVAYKDFVALEKEALVSTGSQDYWNQKLSGAQVINMPRWPQKPRLGKAGEVLVQQVPLSEEVSQGLRHLALSAGVPLKSVLLAAHLRVLSFLSGQEDVTTGFVANGRPEALDSERVLGLFLNTLPFRLHLTGGHWKDLVQQTFATEKEFIPHRRYPLAQIQRNLGSPGLFETSFDMVHFHVYEEMLDHKTIRFQEENFFESTNFTFFAFFQVDPATARISLRFDINAGEFCQEQLEQLTGYFQRTLEEMASNPLGRYEVFSPLSPKEEQRLLVEWNKTAVEAPADQWVHQLIRQQAEKKPDAPAVRHLGQQLTYGELNARANQIARFLTVKGVSQGTMVGIALERSLDMIAAVLGVLKAGGAYVPLDPAYPADRLNFIIGDARLDLILTHQNVALPESRATKICLDAQWDQIAFESPTEPEESDRKDHLAYVIYTSGSTGKPKGVLVNHKNLLHSTNARTIFYREPVGNYLLLSSYAFDSSVAGIFWTLTQGGTLTLPADEEIRDASELAKLIEQQKVTHLLCLPSLYSLMLEQAPLLDSLRTVIVAGESCPLELVRRHQSLLPKTNLYNEYGPTEGTVWSTVYNGTSARLENTVPIGQPIPNACAYILNEQLQPVPIAVEGELFIGGPGVVPGYLNQPDLTREKFLPNPFSSEREARLYKTGDRARFWPDGNIEFLGRQDHQVKLRGYRIELQEIEMMIAQFPGVRQNVVLVREARPGDQRLAAYLDYANIPPDVSQLRLFLKAKLPEYMVPSTYVCLAGFPLTPNGKIDRKALPAPADVRLEGGSHYVAPRTEKEKILCGIWAKILGREVIGIEDNFFDLGGHSLLAMQVISRVRQTFQIDLPLKHLFEASTPGGLAERVEAAVKARKIPDAPPLVPVSRDEPIPLSFAQQRLWFLAELHPGVASYNVPLSIELKGRVSMERVETALELIIARHESLRTRFVSHQGQPVQIIDPPTILPLPLIDLSHLTDTHREQKIAQLKRQEAAQGFDLSAGPLLRATLVRLDEQHHLLLFTMHHIVSDGWSATNFFNELAEIYAALEKGVDPALPELKVQYADFAQWQRAWVQGPLLEEQLGYWKKQLRSAPALLELPADRPRPSLQSFRGACESRALPKKLGGDLEQLSRREGVTLYMTLLAAFQTLLVRYTGQEDICVGSPVANRNRTEIENLIGFFANTLILRTRFNGNPTFRDLLSRVRETALGAYAHQDVPFEKLVEELQPERNLSHNPLFQVMLALYETPTQTLEASGLTLRMGEAESTTSKFDLTLYVIETADGLNTRMEYNTDLFEGSTIRRMLGHFQTLLEGVVRDVDAKIQEVPLLTQEEKQQFLEWNATEKSYPEITLHKMFEEQVKRSPEATALVFEERTLSYKELNQHANHLAHQLRSLGVRPDTLVGICMERSLEMVVGLLGILKAGGAYVPIDPTYPEDRIAFMTQDAGFPVVLTQKDLNFQYQDFKGVVLVVDTRSKPDPNKIRNPRNLITPGNLAYCIYTSGSTGRPKGAMNTHRGICNRLQWMQEKFQLDATEKVLQKTPFSFDVSVWEFFAPLIAGSTLVIARPEGHRDPAYLIDLIQKEQISLLHFVPSMLQVFLEDKGVARCGSVRRVFCSGEALPYELQQRFFARIQAELHNLYGPTEASVEVTHWECQPASPGKIVPIGKPIANTRLYILDRHLQPVPIGVPGELHIGGTPVARGYHNRPQLTAEKFIADPFAAEPGARLYKTGDLCRYLPDGNIHYLGRMDFQIKIRGFRIELEEIETVLCQNPGVRDSVVIAREDTPGNQRLVAYLVPQNNQTVTFEELRAFLKRKLPEYMVPATFVLLEKFPLNSNGKVDRRALPAPMQTHLEFAENYVAPRNAIERKLGKIWGEVLNLDRVGIHDNFFILGGHSILATQIISRIRLVLQTELPLRSIFETPTIAGLASAIEEMKNKPAGIPLDPPRLREDGKPRTNLSSLEALSDEQVDLLLSNALTPKEDPGQNW